MRVAAGEHLTGRLATAFYRAVHSVDPTATEDTLARLPGNSGVQLYESLIAWAALAPGERVIDIGCGSGGAGRAAAAIVGPDGLVVGVDPSAEALAVARQRAPEDLPMAFVRGFAERLPDIPDRSFDCAIASLVLDEVEDLGAALAEVMRVLRPGGRFVASVTAFDQLRPLDASFMGQVLAVVGRRAPGALAGRATRASIPYDPVDAAAFAAAGLLTPEAREVQLAAVMETPDDAWRLFSRTHIAHLLDEDGQAELRATLERRLPHTLYIPLRFLRTRRPG